MSAERPVVRETATVTVDGPVDGTRRRKQPKARRQSPAVDGVTIDPRILAAAKAALRPGERLVLDRSGEVRTVYR